MTLLPNSTEWALYFHLIYILNTNDIIILTYLLSFIFFIKGLDAFSVAMEIKE